MSRGTQNCWYLILVIVYLDTCQLKRKTNFLLFQEFSVSPAHPCKEEFIIINKSTHFNWIRNYQHQMRITIYGIFWVLFELNKKCKTTHVWHITSISSLITLRTIHTYWFWVNFFHLFPACIGIGRSNVCVRYPLDNRYNYIARSL